MEYILFISSFFILFYGGDLLVKSSVLLAERFKVSTLIIGLTVVSFATSAPELFVAMKAASLGILNFEYNDITLGSVLGSNIANISLVLGISAIFFRIPISQQTIRFHYPFLLFASVLFIILLSLNQSIDRSTGLILFSLLVFFISFLIWNSKRKNKLSDSKDVNQSVISLPHNLSFIILNLFGGIVLLIIGSDFLVKGVKDIAVMLKINERVVSVSMVAIGTSIPELSTTLVAAFRNDTNLAVGNLIGSNIFNLLAVIGLTSIFYPIRFSSSIDSLLNDSYWMLFLTILLGLFIFFNSRKVIGRIEGGILFLIYIFFIYSLI
ncbi:MAG: hypothetical protein CMP51_06875 [Flavobacteriales bacterium]|nr:hypothetical protein [Flavobacteriales bacterium]